MSSDKYNKRDIVECIDKRAAYNGLLLEVMYSFELTTPLGTSEQYYRLKDKEGVHYEFPVASLQSRGRG